MYDITSRESFSDLDEVWMRLLVQSIYPNVVPSDKHLVVVGNKSDLGLQRTVSDSEGREFADGIGAGYLETSAKTGQNVDELLRYCNVKPHDNSQ